jgi:hypothetical protein
MIREIKQQQLAAAMHHAVMAGLDPAMTFFDSEGAG